MQEVDSQRVINKLGMRLAQATANNAVLEVQLEDTTAALEAANQQIAALRGDDTGSAADGT